MAALVDIHAHLLPGIDDGPPDMEQALEMGRIALQSGIGTMSATPHLRSDFPGVHIEELAERAEQLRTELARQEISLEVVQAAEASLVWALDASQEHLNLATFGARGHDLLIETPGQTTVLEPLLYDLRTRGLRITLAHPERSPDFQRDPQRLGRLVDQGVLLQINAESLLGPWRSAARKLGQWLCREGIIHAIASDGHRGGQWRPVTRLPEAFRAASGLVGPARAAWMVKDAPAAIAFGLPLPPAPEVEARAPRRRWLGNHN